jgi:Zn-dependent protease
MIGHEMGHVAVCRRRKIPVESITLYLFHGRTAHGFASTRDEILVAWSGVGAQALILLAALAAGYALDPAMNPVVLLVAGTILFVFTKLNLVLMVVALLPIGPFDGRSAWAVIPYVRGAVRRRRQRAREIEMFPEKGLSPERRRELEESSSKAAADLMEKFAKKSNDPQEEEPR